MVGIIVEKNINKSAKEKTAKNNSNSKKTSFLTLSKLNKVIQENWRILRV